MSLLQRGSRLAALLALLAPAVAAAQEAPSSPTVVVTGRRAPAREEVEHLTRAITRVRGEQVARFPDPICPVSAGMPLDYDARIVARLRADAQAAGIAVAPEKCAPNITILIVANGQAIVREIRRTRGWMFSALPDGEADRLIADKGPVHAWTITELRSRDGDRLRGGSIKEDVPELQVRDASILHLPTRQDIAGSVLLLDVDAVIGKTVNQLADYAAMRTLAQTRPQGATGDTILTLFDGGDVAAKPHALTAFDAAYLRSLYHGPATDTAMTKMGAIARDIAAHDGQRR